MVRHTLLFGMTLAVGGCAHTVYFTGRTSGTTAQSTVTAMMGHPSGVIEVTLKGKTYRGRWLYMAGAGSVTSGSMIATAGSSVATGTGTAFAMPMQGSGSILLSAPDGATLRCAFDYSEWSTTGVGVCQESTGEAYDLQID